MKLLGNSMINLKGYYNKSQQTFTYHTSLFYLFTPKNLLDKEVSLLEMNLLEQSKNFIT